MFEYIMLPSDTVQFESLGQSSGVTTHRAFQVQGIGVIKLEWEECTTGSYPSWSANRTVTVNGVDLFAISVTGYDWRSVDMLIPVYNIAFIKVLSTSGQNTLQTRNYRIKYDLIHKNSINDFLVIL